MTIPLFSAPPGPYDGHAQATRILRERQRAIDQLADSALGHARKFGVSRKLVQVFDGGSMPATGDHFFATHPVEINGDETEGGAGTPVVDADTTLMVDVLYNAPGAGDLLTAYAVGGRWVAERENGGGGGGGCTCPTTICVVNCAGVPISGATITIHSLTPCVTTDSGCCSFCLDVLGGAGSYAIVVSAPDYNTFTGSIAMACNGTETVVLLTPTDDPSVCFRVFGCCGNVLPGATVTFDGITLVSDSSGLACFSVAPYTGALAYTVSKARFVTATGTVPYNVCGGTSTFVDVYPAVAAGYACAPGGGAGTNIPGSLYDPVPTTLTLTDSVYGTCALTYHPVPDNYWSGSIEAGSTPPDCGCPGNPTTISYLLTGCGDFAESCYSYNFDDAIPCPYSDDTFGLSLGIHAGFAYTFSLAPTIPFDYQFTFPVIACEAGEGATGVGVAFLYPSGGTITVTE